MVVCRLSHLWDTLQAHVDTLYTDSMMTVVQRRNGYNWSYRLACGVKHCKSLMQVRQWASRQTEDVS